MNGRGFARRNMRRGVSLKCRVGPTGANRVAARLTSDGWAFTLERDGSMPAGATKEQIDAADKAEHDELNRDIVIVEEAVQRSHKRK